MPRSVVAVSVCYRFSKILVSLVGGLSLVGCSSVFVPRIAALKVGVSTETDVIASLGRPDATTLQPDGSKIYRYRLTGNRTSPWNYVPVIGLFAGVWPNVRSVEETLTFNPQGILAETAQRPVPESQSDEYPRLSHI